MKIVRARTSSAGNGSVERNIVGCAVQVSGCGGIELAGLVGGLATDMCERGGKERRMIGEEICGRLGLPLS